MASNKIPKPMAKQHRYRGKVTRIKNRPKPGQRRIKKK